MRRIYLIIAMVVALLGLPQTVEGQTVEQNSVIYVAERVMKAYGYDGDKEKAFTSEEYYRLWRTVEEHDESLVNEVGLFNFNHWYQAQDFMFTPRVQPVFAEIERSGRATVKVCINDGGVPRYITFRLVYERSDWYIDDFVTVEDGSLHSEKLMMRQYILENSIQGGEVSAVDEAVFPPVKEFFPLHEELKVSLDDRLGNCECSPVGSDGNVK